MKGRLHFGIFFPPFDSRSLVGICRDFNMVFSGSEESIAEIIKFAFFLEGSGDDDVIKW